MEIFTSKATEALKNAKKTAKKLKHNYVGTEHILLGLIKTTDSVAGRILADYHVEEEKVLELVGQLIAPESAVLLADREGYSPRARDILELSADIAKECSSKLIGTEHLLLAILSEQESAAAKLINTVGADAQRMYVALMTSVGREVQISGEDMRAHRIPVFTKEASGTATLDEYSRDITALAAAGKLDPVIGRETEIKRVIQILSRRTKNNPCLIGEPGVGKTAIVEGLANRIVSGNVPEQMAGKRLVSLDLSGIVAGSKYRGEFEERMKNILKEVRAAGNILLFVDEIHTLIGAGGAEGAIDASSILKPSLARGEIQLIGATTIEEYRKHIEKDAALERRFQPVTVEEPTVLQAEEILRGLRSQYENHHGVTILDEALTAAVALSNRYINDRHLPDKAIDLIDEAASKVRLFGMKENANRKELEKKVLEAEQAVETIIREGRFEELAQARSKAKEYKDKLERLLKKQDRSKRTPAIVDENVVAEVVAEWTKIPVAKLSQKETERLLALEQTLKKRVIGQEEAVVALAKAVKRGRVGLKDPNRPIGSFLFLGPTGVGKTELSKALAEALFGNEQAMIRVDMSEYMEKHSVSKMIGSPPGYVGHDDGGQLSEKVRRNPYSVILFDEIEKAHEDVFNILLQVLDDGRITDSQGRTVSFKNTVIIMTSNAGASEIITPRHLGFGQSSDEKKNYADMKGRVMDEVRRLFKPEFLNRIDEIMVFHQLNKENVRKIAGLLIKELQDRCEKQMGIRLVVRDSVKVKIAEEGYDPKYGARPLKRVIQNRLEDALAEEILSGRVGSGDTVAAGMHRGNVKFQKI